MDTQKIISLLMAIAVLIVIREGFQQRDRVDPGKGYSKAWHWFGFIMRLLLAGAIYQTSQSWTLTIITIAFLWVGYNMSCNIGAKKPLFYLSDKGIDGAIKRFLHL